MEPKYEPYNEASACPIPEELVHKVAVAIHETAHMSMFRARAIRVLEAIGFAALRQENAQLQAQLEDFQLSQDAIEKAHEAYHAHGWNLTESIKVACAIEFKALRSELQAAREEKASFLDQLDKADAGNTYLRDHLQAAQAEIKRLNECDPIILCCENCNRSHPHGCLLPVQTRLVAAQEQVHQLEDTNDHLRAILTTPEVYVGIVTDACEKHWAELIKAKQEQVRERDAEIERLKAESEYTPQDKWDALVAVNEMLKQGLDASQREVERLKKENTGLKKLVDSVAW